MSSVLATELYAPERTEPVAALPTEAYRRPRTARPVPPNLWRLELAIRAVGRFGLSPTPSILLGFVLVLGASLRTP